MCAAIGARLGLNEDEPRELEFLVQHHLLMSHLAQRRDIHDDQLVIDFCRTCGSVENLQRLYVLTYADMRAVGPGVWNNWRDMLLGELYVRAREFFERGEFVARGSRGARARVRERASKRRARADRGDAGRVDEARRTMPDSYFLSTPEEALIADHGELLARRAREERGRPRPRVATIAGARVQRVRRRTRDRPGLFAMLTGVLAAQRHEHPGGAHRDQPRRRRARRLPRLAPRAGESALDDGALASARATLATCSARQAARRGGSWRRAARPFSTADARAARRDHGRDRQRACRTTYTVLDVYAPIASACCSRSPTASTTSGSRSTCAKITTMVDQVLDVFYVTDRGRKIEDPGRMQAICNAVRQRLEDLRQASA